MHTFIAHTSRLLNAALVLSVAFVVTPFVRATSWIGLVVKRARTNEATERKMGTWHVRVAHLVAAVAVVMSAVLISGGPVPTVDAAPSGFHDGAWTGLSKSVLSKYVDPWGYQYGAYSVAVE